MERIIPLVLIIFLVGSAWSEDKTDWAERLKSRDAEVRSDACLALFEKGETAIDLLAPRLQDRSLLVRHCAAYTLSRIGGERVENIFKQGLRSSSYDVKRISALGLGMMQEEDIVGAVGPLLKDKNWEVRWAAAYALGRGKDRRALGLLSPVASSDPYYDPVREDYPVRQAARKATGRINEIIGWETELPRALALSRRMRKPLLLYFRKTGSHLCSQFERAVFTDEKVIDLAQRLVPAWLDHMVKGEIFSRYQVSRVPSIILLSYDGSEIKRLQGTMDPQKLLQAMEGLVEEERSISRLKARLRRQPRDLETAWQLAELYMDEGLWEEALSPLDLIISSDPDNESSLLDNALFARAYIKGKLGDYKSSRREFKGLVERFSSFGDRDQALYCWGLSALKMKKEEEGKKALRILRDEYPESFLAKAAAKILSQKGKN